MAVKMSESLPLGVFLSSSQGEFERPRKELARRISKMPFLRCTLLEESGADPEDVVEASLRGVRDADIYVAILGKQYSGTTAREFKEAVKERKPPLVYVRKTRVRDQHLREFIDTDVKPNFKFHEFSSSRELYARVDTDLRKLVLRFLRLGLERSKETKEHLVQIEKGLGVKGVGPAWKSNAYELFTHAKEAMGRSALLEATILLRSSLEVGLREALERRAPKSAPSGRQSFSQLVQLAEDGRIVSAGDVDRLTRISRMRNAAAHEGLVPEFSDVRWAIDVGQELLGKWKE